LSFAHQVVIIPGSGKKIQQGKYREIEEAGLIDDLPAEDESPEIASHDKKAPELLTSAATSNKAQELARQTGDITVYSYYFSNVGFFPMFLFVFFVIVNVFSSNFSSNIPPQSILPNLNLKFHRALAEVVD
jgi:ATP-binding cassette subfamily C (CFTR/MRP) protein 1